MKQNTVTVLPLMQAGRTLNKYLNWLCRKVAMHVSTLWQKCASKPLGKWFFSKAVCWKAPYFGSIQPLFEVLEPGRAVVSMRKRRAVQNHIGTVHAIAMCNLAELAAGVMMEVSVPNTMRWLPKGMTVRYLKKATTSVRCEAISAEIIPGGARDVVVQAVLRDTDDVVVCEADITMYLSPKQA
jgi:acyl-coenzyme A thioesterase PaaI-like protein